MIDHSDLRLVNRLRVFAAAAAVFSVAVGISSLAGWKLHSVTLVTWGLLPVRIVPNAAACLVLLGMALLLRRNGDNQSFARAKKRAAKITASAVCMVALLSLAEHILGRDFGIDQLLIVVTPAERIPGLRPGLMSIVAAVGFIVLGLALLLLDWKTRRDHWPAQWLGLVAAICAIFDFFALVLQPKASGITMALPAAVTCLVLACGLVGARPTWAVGGFLASPGAGARLFRKVIPAALLVLSLIGLSITKTLLTDSHFTWVEVSLLALFCSALLTGFIMWVAFIVERSDASNARLERKVAQHTAVLQSEIAERKRAEQELAKKMEELARSNRELEQFAYVASHDLQEPLRMVASYTQLLSERYSGKLDKDADKFLSYAREGALRMQALIRDLMAFSRVARTDAPHKNVDCDVALEEALQSLTAVIAESGAVVTHAALPNVWADQTQIAQVFQNLIGNAIKFHDGAPPECAVRAEKSGGNWLFSVSDNGIGIAPEYAENIFVVFQRLNTRSEYPGNGIGLAICRKIVEHYGGTIWVESKVGEGSTFKFTLPAAAPEEEGRARS